MQGMRPVLVFIFVLSVLRCNGARTPRACDRSTPLEELRHVEPQTEILHNRAIASFAEWVEVTLCGVEVQTLILVPHIFAQILAALVAKFLSLVFCRCHFR